MAVVSAMEVVPLRLPSRKVARTGDSSSSAAGSAASRLVDEAPWLSAPNERTTFLGLFDDDDSSVFDDFANDRELDFTLLDPVPSVDDLLKPHRSNSVGELDVPAVAGGASTVVPPVTFGPRGAIASAESSRPAGGACPIAAPGASSSTGAATATAASASASTAAVVTTVPGLMLSPPSSSPVIAPIAACASSSYGGASPLSSHSLPEEDEPAVVVPAPRAQPVVAKAAPAYVNPYCMALFFHQCGCGCWSNAPVAASPGAMGALVGVLPGVARGLTLAQLRAVVQSEFRGLPVDRARVSAVAAAGGDDDNVVFTKPCDSGEYCIAGQGWSLLLANGARLPSCSTKTLVQVEEELTAAGVGSGSPTVGGCLSGFEAAPPSVSVLKIHLCAPLAAAAAPTVAANVVATPLSAPVAAH